MLPRCRAEQGMDVRDILARRTRLGECGDYLEGSQPDEEHEMKKRDDEHRREGLSTCHRKKLGQPERYDRLVETLEQTPVRTVEQSDLQLKFERERHGNAMKLAQGRLRLETRQQDMEMMRLANEKETLAQNGQAMQTLAQVLSMMAANSQKGV